MGRINWKKGASLEATENARPGKWRTTKTIQ